MDNQWLVLNLTEWYDDCKYQILVQTKEICGAWEGNNIYIYVAHNSETDSNVE